MTIKRMKRKEGRIGERKKVMEEKEKEGWRVWEGMEGAREGGRRKEDSDKEDEEEGREDWREKERDGTGRK